MKVSHYTLENLLEKLDKDEKAALAEVRDLEKRYSGDGEFKKIALLLKGQRKRIGDAKKGIEILIDTRISAGGRELPFSDLRSKKREKKIR